MSILALIQIVTSLSPHICQKPCCNFVSRLCVISCHRDLWRNVFVEMGGRVPKAHLRRPKIISAHTRLRISQREEIIRTEENLFSSVLHHGFQKLSQLYCKSHLLYFHFIYNFNILFGQNLYFHHTKSTTKLYAIPFSAKRVIKLFY